MITYNRYQSITHLEVLLKHLQVHTADPTAILFPDIKAANKLFRELFHLITFRPRFSTQIV